MSENLTIAKDLLQSKISRYDFIINSKYIWQELSLIHTMYKVMNRVLSDVYARLCYV